MYGVLLRLETEITLKGKADIEVLYMDTSGYLMMLDHATIAISRCLVDTRDLGVTSRRVMGRSLACIPKFGTTNRTS